MSRTTRPNIIFILADDLGYGDLGCFGNAHARTPSLDRLAREGVRLTQHYSGSPVCAPARACLLTGRYPHRTGAVDVDWIRGNDRLGLGETTIADVLAANGYATGLVGKWHLGSFDPRYHPNRRGFQEFAGFHFGMADYYHWTLDRNGAAVLADGRYLTDVFTTEGIEFVRRHRQEPFFLYLAYNAPHTPLQVPDEEVAPFRAIGQFTDAVCRLYGMIARMDRGIGQLLEELESLGLVENTIVVFSSDNGPHFAGRGDADQARFNAGLRGHKYLVYEGGVRVPTIVRWPAGLSVGGRLDAPTHFADWLPTLLAAAGVPRPRDMPLDGADALPILRGDSGNTTGEAPRFWQWNRYTPVARCNAAMRDGLWKLVFPLIPGANVLDPQDNALREQLDRGEVRYEDIISPPNPEYSGLVPLAPQLFNVADDPCEAIDLAGAYPARVDAMARAIDAWFAEVEDERARIAGAAPQPARLATAGHRFRRELEQRQDETGVSLGGGGEPTLHVQPAKGDR